MSLSFLSASSFLVGYKVTKLIIPTASTFVKKYSTKGEATFEIKHPYKTHKLEATLPTTCKLTSQEALKMYEWMVVIRRMENTAANLYKEKLIRGFCHLYIGQEAIATGIRSVMREVDSVITAYRCHAWSFLIGDTVLEVLAELTGRKSGSTRGKGGSMHLYRKQFYGGSGIVGAQVPNGAGVAFANKYKGDGGVNFALFGDGASNQGQIFEAMNMAKLLALPCIFICENNEYGMGTSSDRSSANTDYYTRGDYIPGLWVDGMDICATREAAKFAIDYCGSGKGPLVMEMETYRYHGHSMSDPGTSYRSRDEVQEVRQTRDCINNFKKKILEAELVTEDQLKELDSKARNDVKAAAEQAKTDPEIGMEEMAGDVYKLCLEPNNLIRGVHPNAPYKHVAIAT